MWKCIYAVKSVSDSQSGGRHLKYTDGCEPAVVSSTYSPSHFPSMTLQCLPTPLDRGGGVFVQASDSVSL